MKRAATILIIGVLAALVFTSAARADYLEGVITSYDSGNKGTDMTIKTSDGHTRDLWFDNMKKPIFEGKQLPWCPEFPCAAWPAQLALNKTRVRVYVVKELVEGKAIVSPTRIVLLH